MDYTNAMMVWDAVSVRITDVRHRLLIRQQVEEVDENSLFLFIFGKTGRIIVGERIYLLKTSALFHIGRNHSIFIDARDGETEYYLVTYQAEYPNMAGREMMRLLLEENPFDAFKTVRPSDPVLFMRQFQTMLGAWREDSPRKPLAVKSAFYAILDGFYAELSEENMLAPDAVESAKRYLEAHFTEQNSIQMLADVLHISRTTLYTRFKRQLHQSPQQYLMELRLEAAQKALCDTKLTHQEIAVSCGLIDKDYFSRLFKRRYGVSPGVYRKSHQMDEISSQTAYTFAVPAFSRPLPERELLIENLGRIHRYHKIPERIVCLDYPAVEICVALGLGDRVVGISEAEGALEDCLPEYRDRISQIPMLPSKLSKRGMPSFETVREACPDLVFGTSYSFQTPFGVAEEEDFERLGIHIYALKATYILNSTFEDTYEDISNIGRIFGKEKQAEKLISLMREREQRLCRKTKDVSNPVRVFSFDAPVGGKAFTCGASLESHMIHAAGGVNVFGGRLQQFVAVDWEEVADLDPEVILVHRFFDGDDAEQKIEILRRCTEIAETAAMRKGQIFTLGIKKVFPCVDNIETAIQMSEWFQNCRAF